MRRHTALNLRLMTRPLNLRLITAVIGRPGNLRSIQSNKVPAAQFAKKPFQADLRLRGTWELTQGRNRSVVLSVVRNSHNAQVWQHTYKFIEEKNLTPAPFVKQVSLAEAIWRYTCEATVERNPSVVQFAVKVLQQREASEHISGLTQATNPSVVRFVVNVLQERHTSDNIWGLTQGRKDAVVQFVVKNFHDTTLWDDTWLPTHRRKDTPSAFITKDSLAVILSKCTIKVDFYCTMYVFSSMFLNSNVVKRIFQVLIKFHVCWDILWNHNKVFNQKNQNIFLKCDGCSSHPTLNNTLRVATQIFYLLLSGFFT